VVDAKDDGVDGEADADGDVQVDMETLEGIYTQRIFRD
jgi:hypothetical protein